MGTTARVVLTGDGDRLLDHAQARIEDLEARWSRFRPTSELSRLNAASGRTAIVSSETFAVVSRAVDAWFLTHGRFDPTILPALIEAGYDRSFEDLDRRPIAEPIELRAHRPAPGCAEIRLSAATNSIALPAGVHLDLGGIGKGFAADLVAHELMERGARGACVSIGGDLRCAGEPPWGEEGWLVEVEDPRDADETMTTLTLADGAVATTTRAKRRWIDRGLPAHHLIDPATGEPADTTLLAVTVLAAEAWWAEVFAKAAFLAGPVDGITLLERAGLSGFLVDEDGRTLRTNHLAAYTK